MSTPEQAQRVQQAFSRQAPAFDRIDREEPLIQWVREEVRTEVLRWVAPGQRMLELNAGTGLDATFFASKGIRVTATDSAPGMLAQARANVPPTVILRELDYHRLDTFAPASFEHVFSNFGGLNCTDRLDLVLRGIDHVLVPGGRCTLVIMPPVSPWEVIEIFRGHVRLALRRFRKGGAPAHLEGVEFVCHYHSAASIRRGLPGYRMRSLMALSLIVPPPHLGPFAYRHPWYVRKAKHLERIVRGWPLLRGWGDHIVITLQKPG